MACLFYFSSSDIVDEKQFSEFWNRDDDARGSEDDISDSDGISPFVNFVYLILILYHFLLYHTVHCLTCRVLPQLPDDTEVAESLVRSKLPSNSGLEEKIELLQRAEERYYQTKASDRKVEAEKLCLNICN